MAGGGILRGIGTILRRWIRPATACTVAGAVVASMLVVPPVAAQAEPGDSPDRRPPLGARPSAPEQPAGSAVGRPHEASTEDTSAVATSAAQDLEPPEVPGAVEPETTYPDVSLPPVSSFEQDAEISVVDAPVAGFVEGESVELTSMRQPTSQVFQNPDGTRTLRAYDDVAFVPDPQLQALARQGVAFDDGEMLLPVDPSLGTQPDGRLAPVRALPVSFGAQATDAELARIELGPNRRVAFGLDSAVGTDPVVDGSTVTYPDVRDDADIRFTVSSSGLKEEIVLRTPDAPTSWLFPLTVEGVTPSLDEDGRVDETYRAPGSACSRQ